ncbi:tungsten ABC transporter substrate-binding protein [Methylobacterium sp. Leaf456]|uniref:extracellular solute-binding protein n=1 Tax=Methylobacterium sp. Leaf456 TaxID=1736382 RepID=UPI0006F51E5E|nr:extracellular solute-binding protein [Methylobacterium sp. Leaf456]KQT56910.1 tungsten ABC transporter substrate-binding protein [Methylobacterium sp. Leaf456]
MDFLRRGFLTLALAAGLAAAVPAHADPQSIVVASTTSTEQSGLFKHILPLFKDKTGIEVKVVALGTGQALDAARRGDADVVLVHDRAAEDKFVTEGFSKARRDVMYNDFVVIGPKADPAGIKGAKLQDAFKKLAEAKAPFVSRGDRSGTHSAELRAWKEAGVDLAAQKGDWYRDVGQGMGPALNTASALNAYILADRGTWLSFKNRGELTVLVEGDPKLFNPYGVMLVNPDKHPTVKVKEGQAFIDWLVSPEGQGAIASYKIGGEQLFFPSADKAGK